MSKPYRISLPASRRELAPVLERLQEDALEPSDRQLLMHLLQQLLGPTTGTPAGGSPLAPAPDSKTTAWPDRLTSEPKPLLGGHGRRSASDYVGAQRVVCLDAQRQAGDPCPCGGHWYDTNTPAQFLRFIGQPLIGATCYEQTVLRCSSCQQRFMAPLPDGVPAEKYDASAEVAMVLAKDAAGLPFHRLARLQQSCGVPLPESVQWERAEAVANTLLPVYLHLRTWAAQADVLIGDDRRVPILSCERENQQRAM